MNTDETKKENKPNHIVTVKQDLCLTFIGLLLNCIRAYGIHNDKRFMELFLPLENYVNDCLDIPDGLDIVEESVALDCKVIDEEAYRNCLKQK